jgi:DNA-binding transcriptional LysR family regulator
MDRLTAMRVFAEVARSGSFTASADRLEMSRAMVTRHVAEMEQWLGARLLQRTTRRVTLTDSGEQALRHCLRMLEMVEDVQNDVAPADGVLRGQLRVTSSMSFAHAHLAGAVGEFLALHPQLRIDLQVGDSALDLVEARVDLAIRISNDPAPALIARPLGTCDSVLVASPAYLAARGTPRHPKDLARHACLGYANFGRGSWRLSREVKPRNVKQREARGGAVRHDTAKRGAGHGEARPDEARRDGPGHAGARHAREQVEISVVTRLTADEATVLLEAALQGHGIALQPTYLANRHIAAGRLLPVLPQWQPETLAILALYPSRRHLSPAVRALLDFLVARFAQARW